MFTPRIVTAISALALITSSAGTALSQAGSDQMIPPLLPSASEDDGTGAQPDDDGPGIGPAPPAGQDNDPESEDEPDAVPTPGSGIGTGAAQSPLGLPGVFAEPPTEPDTAAPLDEADDPQEAPEAPETAGPAGPETPPGTTATVTGPDLSAVGGGFDLTSPSTLLPNQTGNAAAANAGNLTTLSLTSSLEATDNLSLDSDSSDGAVTLGNTVGFGIRRQTPVQSLSTNVTGTYRIFNQESDGVGSQLDGPTGQLSYFRAVEDSQLSFGLRATSTQLSYFDPLSDIDDDGNFDDGGNDGSRTSVRTNFGTALNTNGPISYGLNGSYSVVRFDDTGDDRQDRRSGTVRGTVGVDVSPIVQLNTSASYGRSESEDGDGSTTRRVDAGASVLLDPVKSLSFDIGYSEVESDRDGDGDGDDTRNAGIVGDVSLGIARPRGPVRFSFSAQQTENGLRYNASLGRTLQREASVFNGNVGVSYREGQRPAPTAQLRYSLFRPGQTISIVGRQAAAVNEDGNDVLNSFAAVSYSRPISAVSNFNASVSGVVVRSPDEDVEARDRLSMQASYNRTLTRDVGYNVGVRRVMRSDDDGDAAANSVFFSISRNFSAPR